MAELNQFVVKDALTVRDDILRTIKNGLIARGVVSPNLGPNTDFYVTATALGNELAVIGANAIIKCDELMIDTAVDEALDRWAAIFGMSLQGAAGSYGFIVLEASATAPIALGAQLQDSAGLRYEVTVGGNYDDGDLVPIRGVDVGAATNHDEDDPLQWASAPPYCADRVVVAMGGLINGVDAETQEGLRTRVLAKLQAAPASGNCQHVAEITESADVRVQKAFVYPAVQGPASFDVAAVAAPTDTEKGREIASALMTGTIAPFVEGTLPEHSEINVTTVVDVPVGVAFGLSLPEAPTASPPGPGGGWVNGSPWPAPDGSASFRCTVTVATSSTTFTVDALTTPAVGISRIAWVSPLTWTLYTALVTAVSGTSGAYVVTIDNPFVGIAVGNYIWPECENAQAYVNTVLDAFALMGPGEKTDNSSALIRGFRHPSPASAWPYTLGPHLLRPVTAIEEVAAAQFFHRTDGTTTLTGPSGSVSPQAPAASNDPPNIFTPENIAFYRIP